jgi:hypothetical protein
VAHRVLENLQSKSVSDHDFAHVVENRSGIITVDTDGTVFGNGMYDGRFNTGLKTDRNGIIRPYALSLFRAAPRNVLMIGLSSGSWAQVIASNTAVEQLTIVEINRGYLELISQHPDVQSVLRNPKVRIIEDDGRRWLSHHPQMQFDAIVSISTWHFRANITNLLVGVSCLGKAASQSRRHFLYNTTGSARAAAACTAFPMALDHQSYGGLGYSDRLEFRAVAVTAGELQDRRQRGVRSEQRRRSIPDRFDHERVPTRRPNDRRVPGAAVSHQRHHADDRRQYGQRVALLSSPGTPILGWGALRMIALRDLTL